MHRGFDLNLSWDNDLYYRKGLSLYEQNKNFVMSKLESFITSNGSLNGSKMQSDWFPQISTNIFISHSHKNEKQAITLSGWLYHNFGLLSFVDSCIWGNSDSLLRILDRKYCYDPQTQIYDYDCLKNSSSHIHMMLSTALSMMIDNSECLIFLRTSDSVVPSQVISNTRSPWIYFEMATSKLIRKKTKEAHRLKQYEYFSADGINESAFPNVEYQLYLSHLVEIDKEDLLKWLRVFNKYPNTKYPLDILYDFYEI